MSNKIYILSTHNTFGGGEIFQIKLAALLHPDIHITVVSPPLIPLKKGMLQRGGQFIELPTAGGLPLRYAFLMWLWRNRIMLRETHATVVLNGRGSAYWAPVVRLLVSSGPLIICHTEFSLKKTDIKERLYGIAAQFSRCVVAVSESVAAQHRQRWPGIAVEAIPNWIDGGTENISTGAGHRRSPNTPVRLAVIGRLAPGKGIEDIVAACAESLGIELHFFGHGPLRDRIDKMGANMPWLHLHGHVDNLAERLPDHDILISASYSESFSYAVAEGIQSGVLCVVSDIPAHRELLGPNYPESLFFPPGDTGALRYALQMGQAMVLENEGMATRQAVAQARSRIGIRNTPLAARKNYLRVLTGQLDAP